MRHLKIEVSDLDYNPAQFKVDQRFLVTWKETESLLLLLKDSRASIKTGVNDFYVVYPLQNSLSSTMRGLFRPLVECENSWTAVCGA